MRHVYAVKKLSKFGQVLQREGTTSNFYCVIGARVIEWFTSNHFGYQEVNCLKIRGINDHDDVLSDYHAGSYVDSLDQAIRRALNAKHKRFSFCLIGDRNFTSKKEGPSLWVTCSITYETNKFIKVANFELSGTIVYTAIAPYQEVGTSTFDTTLSSSADEVIAIAEGIQERGVDFPTNVLHGFLEDTFPAAFDYMNDFLDAGKDTANVSE